MTPQALLQDGEIAPKALWRIACFGYGLAVDRLDLQAGMFFQVGDDMSEFLDELDSAPNNEFAAYYLSMYEDVLSVWDGGIDPCTRTPEILEYARWIQYIAAR